MNDINLLMQRVDEINAKDPPLAADEVEILIAHYRHQRSQKAAGIKPDKPKIDVEAILGLVEKPKVERVVTRRF